MTTELSLLANYDDLQRCSEVLTDGTAEKEYRRFLEFQEQSRMQWHETIVEAKRLQKELDKCAQERADLEMKLFHARRLLEMESKARRVAEMERDALDKKLSKVCEYLRTDQDINDETRNRLAFLDKSARKRKSNHYIDDKFADELNSTGSFLSNLSVTQSEEDFLEVQKPFKKHRSSITGVQNDSYTEVKSSRNARRSGANDRRMHEHVNVIDLDSSDKIVATTKVSIPQGDGPIEATSTIEAVPNSTQYNNHFDKIETIESTYETTNNKENEYDGEMPMDPPYKHFTKLQQQNLVPSAPPLHEVNSNSKLLLNLQGRQHEFTNKTIIRNESCSHCLKRFRVCTTALKCRVCSLLVHQDCKIQMDIACVPKSNATPMKNGKQGYVSEYVPNDGPLVPGLIVHCVNEVETRGLTEQGIYRVSGSQKEIKALKERFLRGKSVPALGEIDLHVICGCIKDFLRDLREPLLPTRLWAAFANAVQNFDDKQAVRDLHIALNQLPQANRDTLAFLILHLQRVASCQSTKMSIENLATVFGPTVMGFSSMEIHNDQAIFSESIIQKEVMENLLNIPTDYWARFITIPESDSENEKISVHSYFGTPGMRICNTTFRKDRKFFATPPHMKKRNLN